MGNSIFNIGLSGLYAAQAGLATTSHNVSNVNTPGYTRQTILQGTATPQFTGAGYIGTGATVDSVRRIYDEFLTTHVRTAQAGSSQLSTYATHVATLDMMFGDPTAGLAPALADFFAGVNAVANNPADIPSRQVMLTSAQTLAGRFNDLAAQLDALRIGVNQEIGGAISEINTAATELANLNQRIALASATGGATRPPNDLLDQRDALLAQLNEQVGATAVAQADGSLNVYLGNGQPLVVGRQAFQLAAVPGNDDPKNVDVALVSNGTMIVFRPGDLTGGALAGALQYRAGVLDPAQDKLGAIALTIAQTVNAQHALGQDLNGQLGGKLFSVPAPTVQGALANTGTATLAASVADATALTGSNYTLQYDGVNYTLTRLSDNATQTFASLPQTVDGLTLGVGSGTPAAGDRYTIQPTRNAARDIGVSLTDVRAIAAGAPVRTTATLANAGTAVISPGSVDATFLGTPLAAPVTITYNVATGTFSGFPLTQPVVVTNGGTSTTYPAGAPVPYTAGATMTFGGISFAVSGAPANGDTFTIARNAGGTGDGRNALLLGNLATQGGLVSGGASLVDAYGQLTSFVGTAAHQAKIEADAGDAMLTQAQNAQQSVSGVNLDEEAANLQRYQQAYQAAGKVMAIADSLFQTILGIANG